MIEGLPIVQITLVANVHLNVQLLLELGVEMAVPQLGLQQTVTLFPEHVVEGLLFVHLELFHVHSLDLPLVQAPFVLVLLEEQFLLLLHQRQFLLVVLLGLTVSLEQELFVLGQVVGVPLEVLSVLLVQHVQLILWLYYYSYVVEDALLGLETVQVLVG